MHCKTIAAVVGLSLLSVVPAWSQERPTNQSADWFAQHPEEDGRAVAWCNAHPDEMNRMAAENPFNVCVAAFQGEAVITSERVNKLKKGAGLE